MVIRRIVAAILITCLFVITGCTGLTHSSTQAISTNPNGVNSASSNSISGLSLSLFLDEITYQPGQTVTIVLDETNTLSKTNNVHTADEWALVGLSVSPCGTLNYPFGVAVFQGYYTSGDISSVTPLKLYNTDVEYHCPMILSQINTYAFHPSSDTAAVSQMSNTSPVITEKMNAEIQPTGYWTGSPTETLTNFAPGVYTVVGGDEWGALVVLHFTISPSHSQLTYR